MLSPTDAPPARHALGDLQLEGKARLASFVPRADDRLHLAAAVGVGLPTGDENAYYADGLSLRPRLVSTYAAPWGAELALQLGAVLRSTGSLADVEFGQQAAYVVVTD